MHFFASPFHADISQHRAIQHIHEEARSTIGHIGSRHSHRPGEMLSCSRDRFQAQVPLEPLGLCSVLFYSREQQRNFIPLPRVLFDESSVPIKCMFALFLLVTKALRER
ncbi:hypothetical protein NDU88_007020 [Pleurodeles waltl]|uniref:Uncharacterized protein n=1 Tax=Pleurodeles waltl TaxID=8319 RepID=A0AAV7NWT3_PLEWA|nr:hypothetical protein NDU88_007020 [Pleurodeles waltl]